MFKKIGLTLVACLALAAVSASGAQAAEWTVGGEGLKENEKVSVSNMGNFTLESKVLGATVKLTATGLECSGTCELTAGGATAMGALKFTGVTFDEPSTCSVEGGAITTLALTAEVIMDPEGGEATFVKFAPAAGNVFTEFKVIGATCPLNGVNVKVKGTVAGRANNTEVDVTPQPLNFNAFQQATGGGSLTLGAEPATLTGEATNTLAGPNHSGAAFGVK